MQSLGKQESSSYLYYLTHKVERVFPVFNDRSLWSILTVLLRWFLWLCAREVLDIFACGGNDGVKAPSSMYQ